MGELGSEHALLYGAIFLGISCAALLLLGRIWRPDPRLANRFQRLAHEDEGIQTSFAGRPWKSYLGYLLRPVLPNLAERLLPNDEQARNRLQQQLIQAGIYQASALPIYVVAKLLCMLAPPVAALAVASAGWISFPRALLAGSLLGMAGLTLPILWLERRKAWRKRGLRRSLPDFLDLSIACLESGMSMPGAVAEVAKELQVAHPDLAREFGIVQGEMELGRPLDDAVSRLAERSALEEFRSLATFVRHAQTYGATMAGAMRELSEMLRVQREQRMEEMAQKAAVKILIPTLLFIFPAIFVVLAGPAAIKIQTSFAKQNDPGLGASK